MNLILNLTQENASEKQWDAGVRNLGSLNQKTLRELLTFSSPPDSTVIEKTIITLADMVIAERYNDALIEGPLWLMFPLELYFHDRMINVHYVVYKHTLNSFNLVTGKSVISSKCVGFITRGWDS